jgi:hypothetical protein
VDTEGGHDAPYIVHLSISDNPPSRVADFIQSGAAEWNEDKLRHLFHPMDVHAIMEIPLSHRRQEDFWSWHYERKGVFSVKSAYNMLINTCEKREAWLDGRASGSDVRRTEKQWSSLWRTPVPSKMRVFLWRLAKQSIPTNEVRFRQKMAESSCCQLCGCHDSWRHALLECTMSRCVWALADAELAEHVSCSEEGNAREWLAAMMQSLKQEDQTRVFVTLWAIWHARRKAIHEQIFQSPLTVHMFVQNFVSDLNLSEQEKKKQAPAMHVPTNEGWILPPSGMAKINIDPAVGKNSIRGAAAAVARNELGEFLGASATIFKG